MRALPAVGKRLADVLTPALLVSLPALEGNEARMRSLLRTTGVGLRPHAKAHKSSEMGKWLLERAGSEINGFCVQTVGEAESMVAGAGAPDVLLTNEVYGPNAARLAALAAAHPQATIGALVDSLAGVQALDAAAAEAGAKLAAWVEIDAGQGRCGLERGSTEAVAVAKAVLASPALTFGGLQVYHGAIQHLRSVEERRAAVEAGPVDAARRTVEALAAHGIVPPMVTGGGTGTFLLDVEQGVHGEVQPGSYLFMDGDYGQNADRGFEQSLFVHTTVISSDEASGKRVVDAGTKAVDLLCGPPTLALLEGGAGAAIDADSLAGITFNNGGDEHGILRGVPAGVLPVGSTVQLIPSHCDPCVNLHDCLLGVRAGVVEAVYPIDARGPG